MSRKASKNKQLRLAALASTTLMIGAGLAITSVGTANAKEIGSGGTPAPTTCSPVSSLTAKGDARVGETGLASVTISYQVKPCTKGQTVNVAVALYRTANPADVFYRDPAAPLGAKLTLAGITVSTSYTFRVDVTDAATGAPVGSASVYAGATRKVGV